MANRWVLAGERDHRLLLLFQGFEGLNRLYGFSLLGPGFFLQPPVVTAASNAQR